MTREFSRRREVPLIIHVVNVAALLLGSKILLLTAVVKTYQLAVLLAVLVAAVVYWRLRTDPRVAAGYFGLSIAVFGWIFICENIVTIDNTFGSQISQSLHLDIHISTCSRTSMLPCIRGHGSILHPTARIRSHGTINLAPSIKPPLTAPRVTSPIRFGSMRRVISIDNQA
jgi:hypothetical protein